MDIITCFLFLVHTFLVQQKFYPNNMPPNGFPPNSVAPPSQPPFDYPSGQTQSSAVSGQQPHFNPNGPPNMAVRPQRPPAAQVRIS